MLGNKVGDVSVQKKKNVGDIYKLSKFATQVGLT